jgi:hypothetical protein
MTRRYAWLPGPLTCEPSGVSCVPGGRHRRAGGDDTEDELDPDHDDASEPSHPSRMRRISSTPSSGIIGCGGGWTLDRA